MIQVNEGGRGESFARTRRLTKLPWGHLLITIWPSAPTRLSAEISTRAVSINQYRAVAGIVNNIFNDIAIITRASSACATVINCSLRVDSRI